MDVGESLSLNLTGPMGQKKSPRSEQYFEKRYNLIFYIMMCYLNE